jgi:DNA-binding SARP family transcriptional activator
MAFWSALVRPRVGTSMFIREAGETHATIDVRFPPVTTPPAIGASLQRAERGASGAAHVVARRQRSRTTGLRLQLLRGFGLVHAGETIAVPLAGQRVAAFLALRGRPVHRLVVAGTLWMDSSEEQAGASLRTALWRLRLVAGDLVAVNGSALTLADDVRVDVREAQRRAALLVKTPEEYGEQDLAVLEAEGDVLPDWYEDWVLVERERYRQLRLHALEALCRALASAGAHAEAISAGLAAVACEPLRESAHRALMQAHVAEGNVCEALRQYELFRGQLMALLGLEPSRRMQMLVARLRQT